MCALWNCWHKWLETPCTPPKWVRWQGEQFGGRLGLEPGHMRERRSQQQQQQQHQDLISLFQPNMPWTGIGLRTLIGSQGACREVQWCLLMYPRLLHTASLYCTGWWGNRVGLLELVNTLRHQCAKTRLVWSTPPGCSVRGDSVGIPLDPCDDVINLNIKYFEPNYVRGKKKPFGTQLYRLWWERSVRLPNQYPAAGSRCKSRMSYRILAFAQGSVLKRSRTASNADHTFVDHDWTGLWVICLHSEDMGTFYMTNIWLVSTWTKTSPAHLQPQTACQHENISGITCKKILRFGFFMLLKD